MVLVQQWCCYCYYETGSEGMKPTIEFNARYGWQELNSNDMKTLNAEEYKTYSKKANLLEAFRNGGITYFNRNTWI